MLPQLRKRLMARRPAGVGSLFLSLIPWVLLGALAAQAAVPGLPATSGPVGSAAPSGPDRLVPEPSALAAPSGPTVSEFRAAFSGGRVTRVDPATFNQYVGLHSGQGRLLTGQTLAALVSGAAVAEKKIDKPLSEPGMYLIAYGPPPPKPKFDPLSLCKDIPVKQRKKCRDSLKVVVQRKSDSIRVAYKLQSGDSLVVLEILEEELFPLNRRPDPTPFSFKDSIPDLDTNYIDVAPNDSIDLFVLRRDHRNLVRSYYAYRDSVRSDSLAALAGSSTTAPRAIREMQARDSVRKDSPARNSAAFKPAPRKDAERYEDDRDTLVLGVAPAQETEADHTRADEYETEQRTGWFVNLFADVRDGHGGGGWSGDDWAAVIYVVIGVVVVGAFIIYGVQTLTELAINKDGYPLFMEAGLRLSYSGKAFRDPNGNGDLYRDAYLAGLRYAIGFDRPGMGIGIAVEGGYIDVFLRGIDDPAKTFDFKGGYMVAGPMLRFGDNKPWSFSLEFLNGTSSHASIGWISKTRMTLQAKVARHTLVGAHLGAVFYDLHFLDGLGVREGNFNRDLSLVYGLDTGWEF